MAHKGESIHGIVQHIILLIKNNPDATIHDCMDELGERGIAIVILFFSLLNSLPMPGIPGFSTVTGIPIILLAAQLVIGRTEIWLPQRIKSYRLKQGKLLSALERIVPTLRKAERILKPRIDVLSSEKSTRVLGLAFIGMGILLALPIPFANFPAGFSMSLLAIGIIAGDGLVILLGLLCTTFAFTLIIALLTSVF